MNYKTDFALYITILSLSLMHLLSLCKCKMHRLSDKVTVICTFNNNYKYNATVPVV